MVLGLVADVSQSMGELPEDDLEGFDLLSNVVLLTGAAAIKGAASKTWLQGLADFTNVYSDPDRYATDWLTGFAGNILIPFSSAQTRLAASEDPFAREAFDVWESIQKRLPGLRDGLGIRRDGLGRPVADRSSLWNPILSSTESDHPLDKALFDLDYEVARPSRTLEGIWLDSKQFSRLLELRGREQLYGEPSLLDALTAFVGSDDYTAIVFEDGKRQAIGKIVSRYTRAARAALLEEDETLRNEVLRRRQVKGLLRGR